MGLVAFVVAIYSAAGGHGSYMPFAVLFPYSFLATVALGDGIGVVAGTLTLAQFPVYAVVLRRACLTGTLWQRAAWVIATHVLVAAVCVALFFAT